MGGVELAAAAGLTRLIAAPTATQIEKMTAKTSQGLVVLFLGWLRNSVFFVILFLHLITS